MPILGWNNKFNLRIELLDGHHRHMVSLLNCAYDNFAENSNREALCRVIEELIDYTDHHFCVEEHWMKKTAFPQYAEQVEQHRSFARRAVVIKNDLALGLKNLPLEVLDFFRNWLTYHIEADAGFALYMSESQSGQCAA